MHEERRPARARSGAWRTLVAVAALLGAASAGAQPAARGFVASDNPFQYAGEYRDPNWNGLYLRARWYHPELQAFLSRDPKQELLGHYTYADGNPVRRVDPSGMSYRDFGRRTARALHRLNGGIGGHFARFFLSPVVGLMQILASPQSFWHGITHDTAGMDIFLAVGIVSEGGTSALALGARQPSLLGHIALDGLLGTGQAIASAISPDGKHFNWKQFGQGMEYAAGPIVESRLLLGFGYQPFRVSPEEAEIAQGKLPRGDVDVYRARVGGWTTPWKRFGGKEYLVRAPGSYADLVTFVDMETGKVEENAYGILRDELRESSGLGPKAKVWLEYQHTVKDLKLLEPTSPNGLVTQPSSMGLGHAYTPAFANVPSLDDMPTLTLGPPSMRRCSSGANVVARQLYEDDD